MTEIQRQNLNEVMQALENGVREVFTSDRYKEYLTFLSKFHNYSYGNCLLIMSQCPQATFIAGFNDWKNKHKRFVKKGEKGIKILAPKPYKEKIEVPIFNNSGQPVISDGQQMTETKIIERLSFFVVNVFDVSQTDGQPLPEKIITPELKGSVENYNSLFEAINKYSSYNIVFEDITSGAKGYCNYTENKIAICNGMSEVQTIKTAIHEIAHSHLHSPNDIAETTHNNRSLKEVQAESVAFTVCNYLGIDTSDYSFDYIANWGDMELHELKDSLNVIQKEASAIISGIEQNLSQLSKSKDIEVTDNEASVTQSALEEKVSSDIDLEAPLDNMLIERANAVSMIDMGTVINNDYQRDIETIKGLNISKDTKAEALKHLNKLYSEELLLQTSAVNPYVSGPAHLTSDQQSHEFTEAVSSKHNEIIIFVNDLKLKSRANDKADRQANLKQQIINAEEKGLRQFSYNGVTYYKHRTNWSTTPLKTQQTFSQEENRRIISDIKTISIKEYAAQIGFSVKAVGSYYTLKEHDSVRIDPKKNRFVRNSTGAKGSIIDFVMEFEHLDRSAAIDKLAKLINKDIDLKPISVNPDISNRPTELVLPERAGTMRNIYAYLVSTRKIDSQIVSSWVKAGRLYQDTHNNCVFVTNGKDNKPAFVSLRGTHTGIPFKSDLVGSDYAVCHFINNNARTLVVCESVIDLMSVQTILKSNGRDLANYNFLSLNGTSKVEAIRNALAQNQNDKVIIAVDNDEAGRTAATALKKIIAEKSTDIEIVDFIPQHEKDWNAELVANVFKGDNKEQEQLSSLSEKIQSAQETADRHNNHTVMTTPEHSKKETPNL